MNNSPNIEVGIIEADRITFNLSGKFELFGTGKTCYNECTAYVSNDNIVIENEEKEYQPGKKLTFVPCDLNTDYFELKDVLIGIGFHWEKKENQKFQGALKLKVKGNKLLVINLIPVENYLLSVISSEMNSTSSLELLKAHAIISRSWLMAQLGDGKKRELIKPERKTGFDPQNPPEEFISWYDREDHTDFHVCADDHCQRYQGIERMKNPDVIKAVNETRGEVLTYMDEICDARYSKCCGGITESFEKCWENDPKPYLVSVFDGPDVGNSKPLADNEESMLEYINTSPGAYCNTSDRKILSQVLNDYDLSTHDFFRWEVKYSVDEISKILYEKSGVDFGRIKDLIPVRRTNSGRLVKLKIVGEKRSMIIGKELIIRRWLSKSHLYSSAFIIEKEGSEEGFPESFILKGSGWGHGVGLCQIGAAVMGEKGFSYREILRHYYHGIAIKKLYQ